LKTIKIPYTCFNNLSNIIRQYSCVLRYSYNRFLENKSEKEIRLLIKSLNGLNLLNSWLIQCAIRDAKAVYARFGGKKVVFGGKLNLIKYLKKKINKTEYSLKRLLPVNIQGEELQKGNRMFKLDILCNNKIVFKLNKNCHIDLLLPKLRKNIKSDLLKLEQINKCIDSKKGHTYTIRFNDKYLFITFKQFESSNKLVLNNKRYIGIDLNPDTIGISIMEDRKVIECREWSLKEIFNKIFSEKLDSSSDRMKLYQNKLKFETFEIAKSIDKLARHYQCKSVFIEDLSFKGSSGIKKSNRKNKNLWKRELFRLNLQKRLGMSGIDLFEVNPAYSSFIGNMQYDWTDAINASIEIGRRGYLYRIKKIKDSFYPTVWLKRSIQHQWKEMGIDLLNTWKDLFLIAKNSKLKYRVSLQDAINNHHCNVFQQNSHHKSNVLNYQFL